MKISVKTYIIINLISLSLPTIVTIQDYVTHFDISAFEFLSLFYVGVIGLVTPFLIPEYMGEKYGDDVKFKILGTYQFVNRLILIWVLLVILYTISSVRWI